MGFGGGPKVRRVRDFRPLWHELAASELDGRAAREVPG